MKKIKHILLLLSMTSILSGYCNTEITCALTLSIDAQKMRSQVIGLRLDEFKEGLSELAKKTKIGNRYSKIEYNELVRLEKRLEIRLFYAKEFKYHMEQMKAKVLDGSEIETIITQIKLEKMGIKNEEK